MQLPVSIMHLLFSYMFAGREQGPSQAGPIFIYIGNYNIYHIFIYHII